MATQQSTRTAGDAIMAGNQRFMEAFRKADPDAVAACYTPDAQLLPPNGDFVGGQPAIATFWRGLMEQGAAGVRLESVEVDPHDDTVIEVGRYAVTDREGAQLDRGKFLVVWRQQGGEWRIHRDIWNTSMEART